MSESNRSYKSIDRLAVNSLCGIVDCSICSFYKDKQCKGCILGNHLLADNNEPVCKMYECISDKGLFSCRDCKEYPCPKFDVPEEWESLGAKCKLSYLILNGAQKEKKSDRIKKSGKTSEINPAQIPEKVITRLVWYLSCLGDFSQKSVEFISSEEIADNVGVKSSLVRKDLSIFGEFGMPKRGYNVEFLEQTLLAIFNINRIKNMVWVGVSRFKESLGLLPQFSEHNCRIIALFSYEPELIGKSIINLTVFETEKMPVILKRLKINSAVLAATADKAQTAADALVSSGVKNILNYSNTAINVPEGIMLKDIGLAHDLKMFSFYSIKD